MEENVDFNLILLILPKPSSPILKEQIINIKSLDIEHLKNELNAIIYEAIFFTSKAFHILYNSSQLFLQSSIQSHF